MRSSRFLVALTAAAVLTLSACDGDVPAAESDPSVAGSATSRAVVRTPAAPSVSAQPDVGDCWQADYAVAWSWLAWRGADAVACSEPHNSITYSVETFTSDAPYPTQDESGELVWDDTLSAELEDTCIVADVPDAVWDRTRLGLFTYLPSAKQWAAGERWIRCDVGVSALGALADNVMETLPATADDVFASAQASPSPYAACIDTPRSTLDAGPLDDLADSAFVSCDGTPQWRYGTDLQLGAADAPFPGEDAELAAIDAACAPLIGEDDQIWMYWPSADGWAAGWRTGSCWLGATSSSV
ncbi:MAG TPA: septum formation family protein [Actinotalea sp.]